MWHAPRAWCLSTKSYAPRRIPPQPSIRSVPTKASGLRFCCSVSALIPIASHPKFVLRGIFTGQDILLKKTGIGNNLLVIADARSSADHIRFLVLYFNLYGERWIRCICGFACRQYVNNIDTLCIIITKITLKFI